MISRIGKNDCFGYAGFLDNTREPRDTFPSSGTRAGSGHKARIILVDSRPLTRNSLAHVLSGRSPVSRRVEDFMVWPVANVEELSRLQEDDGEATAILLNLGPDCVSDPEVREQQHRLSAAFPTLPLVLVSDCANPQHVLGALRDGARGYIPSVLVTSMALQALRLVLAGGVFVPPNLLENGGAALADAPRHPGECEVLHEFTPRQSEVFQLLRKGKSNKVIAYELGMRESTVKVHVRQIMRKLKATNRTHAAFLAARMAGERVG